MLKQLLYKFLRSICTIIFALLISFIVIQDDPWLRQKIEQGVQEIMSRWYGCDFKAGLSRLDLLNGTIEMQDIVVACPNPMAQQSWHWQARRATITWSWWQLMRGKKCSVACVVDQLECASQVSRSGGVIDLAIMPHLLLLAAPPEFNIPFDLNEVSLRSGILHLYEQRDAAAANHPYECHLAFSGGIRVSPEALRAHFECEHGVVMQGDAVMAQNIMGAGTWSLPNGNAHQNAAEGVFEGGCAIPGLPAGFRCYQLKGTMKGSALECAVNNDAQQLRLTCRYSGDGLGGELVVPWCEGTSLNGVWTISPAQASGTIVVPQVTLPSWVAGGGVGTFHAVAHSEQVELTARLHEQMMRCVIGLFPTPWLKHAEYYYRGAPMVACTGTPDSFEGTVPCTILQALAQRCGIELQGEGIVRYTGIMTPTGVEVKATLEHANIRVPYTYGVVQRGGLTLQADTADRVLLVRDAELELYKSSITCSRATVRFDDAGNITYVHLPLLMHNYLFGWKKEFFAQISGACMLCIVPRGDSSVAGSISIDQAHVRGNLLSADFQHEFLGAALDALGASLPAVPAQGDDDPWLLDISYATRAPLEIKTPFLEASVICSGHVGGTLQSPDVRGGFEFVRGTLGFPYKPLFITKGSVTIRPEALHDPDVHLVARNYIKKYDVEMAITGSARDPHITFTSIPHLEQAQIITLLLGGSEDGSLYFLMPKVITDTIETLLFGSAETTSRVQKYLNTLFRPFKRVSITPRLSDQAGRGGVRGAIELEVNDRLRAVIEKNISLPEDTTFEVEYDISDDARCRMMRDERGDLGLEGEMRWKF